MVKIVQKDFNMDMDRYIKNRRDREEPEVTFKDRLLDMRNNMNEWKIFSLFKKKESDEEYLDEDELLEEDVDNFSEEESEIEAIDELEDELEERRESVLKRFFKKLRLFNRSKVSDEGDLEDDYYEEDDFEEDDSLDDIKDVIKITHTWLEQLPPETLDRFKRSEDFVKYKEVLKKLKMIK